MLVLVLHQTLQLPFQHLNLDNITLLKLPLRQEVQSVLTEESEQCHSIAFFFIRTSGKTAHQQHFQQKLSFPRRSPIQVAAKHTPA